MTHDPMCIVAWQEPGRCARCVLIARVRADEREQAAARVAAVALDFLEATGVILHSLAIAAARGEAGR